MLLPYSRACLDAILLVITSIFKGWFLDAILLVITSTFKGWFLDAILLVMPTILKSWFRCYIMLHLQCLRSGLGVILLVTISSILSKASPNAPI